MSIIHEALKKVQTNLQGQQQQANNAPQSKIAPPNPPSQAIAQSQNFFLIPLLLAAVVATTTVLWLILPKIEQNPPPPALIKERAIPKTLKTESNAPTAKAIVPAAAASPVTSPATSTDPSSSITLQGVMINNGKSVALINDAIYELGEEVNGAKILTIEEKTVTILKDGKEETLKIKR